MKSGIGTGGGDHIAAGVGIEDVHQSTFLGRISIIIGQGDELGQYRIYLNSESSPALAPLN
jgi:hypothetical protein